MENLHAPTVVSRPTSVPPTHGPSHLTIADLHAKKEAMEAELRALGAVLNSHGVDMNTSLVDSEGFPRAEIDVAQIRTTRARIIHLLNDYKELMGVVEKHVHGHFASIQDDPDNAATSEIARTPSAPAECNGHAKVLLPPFAKVNSVALGSPADEAGLRAGDVIRVFGDVNITNNQWLQKLPECVQANEGKPIAIEIVRNMIAGQGEELELCLTPRKDWGGMGILGCHIVPL